MLLQPSHSVEDAGVSQHNNHFTELTVQERLLSTYGEQMTYQDLAKELYLSPLYLSKKVGLKAFEHLDWVLPIRNARYKRGRFTYFKTALVAKFIQGRAN